MTKRLFDVAFAIFGLIILSPVFLAVASLIKIKSPGPVFFKGTRIGKDGKPFKMLKFRTMVVGAEKMGGPSTAADDPRLLKIGSVLKKYQLDELPQLVNVLKGEMSFVGPRPEVPVYVNMMTEEEKKIILPIKPGMTDLASLRNFHEGEALKSSEDPEKVYLEKIRPEKIRLQIEYVKTHSFLLDLKIIFKTISKIFK